MSTPKQIKALTQSIEIFYTDDQNNQCSRVFKLTEHTRDQLEEFVNIQVKSGKEAEEEAQKLESLATGDSAGELTKAAYAVPANVAAKVVHFCLQDPEDNEPPPTLEWVKKHLSFRKMKQVIAVQEELDCIDDALKKNVNLIMATALQTRLQKMKKASKKPKAAKALKTPKKRRSKAK